jgi:hypothetical protein
VEMGNICQELTETPLGAAQNGVNACSSRERLGRSCGPAVYPALEVLEVDPPIPGDASCQTKGREFPSSD